MVFGEVSATDGEARALALLRRVGLLSGLSVVEEESGIVRGEVREWEIMRMVEDAGV